MTRKLRLLPLWLLFATAIALHSAARPASAQNEPGSTLPESVAPAAPAKGAPAQASPAKAPMAGPIQIAPAKTAEPADSAAQAPDRGQAYYHSALASTYEEEAVTTGHPELVTQAIEEYKLALNADPTSSELSNALADLYFRSGHTHEAESTARALLKSTPDDIDAHKLLGRIYLRELSEGKDASPSTSSSSDALDQAIAEFEQVVALDPTSVEDRMVLGQLYTVKHDEKKAEEQFKTAQDLEPDSEEVVLNLARLYAESGDIAREAKVIEAVPVDDRTPKLEDALGAAYEQLKQGKDAIAAYQRAIDMDPADASTRDALAQALLNDNQLDEALKQYNELAEADPDNAGDPGSYRRNPAPPGKVRGGAGYHPQSAQDWSRITWMPATTRGCCWMCWAASTMPRRRTGRWWTWPRTPTEPIPPTKRTTAASFWSGWVRCIASRTRSIRRIATFQKMIDMGGDAAVRGYQYQVDTYRDAKQFDKAVEVARKAVEANPKDRDLKLMLAVELGDLGKIDEGLAMAKGLLANTAEDRPVWLEMSQIYIRAHRWKEAEDAINKAEPLTTKKEDRTYLSSSGANSPSGKSTTSQPSSSSARRWSRTQTTP